MSMIAVLVFTVVFVAVFLAVLPGLMCLIMGYICFVVPFIAYEIDGAAASVIFEAVLTPVFLMTGRYMHVDRLINDTDRRGLNYDWMCVNDLRLRKVPDVDATVKARLADTDRHADIGGVCRHGTKDDHDGEQYMFHS